MGWVSGSPSLFSTTLLPGTNKSQCKCIKIKHENFSPLSINLIPGKILCIGDSHVKRLEGSANCILDEINKNFKVCSNIQEFHHGHKRIRKMWENEYGVYVS